MPSTAAAFSGQEDTCKEEPGGSANLDGKDYLRQTRLNPRALPKLNSRHLQTSWSSARASVSCTCVSALPDFRRTRSNELDQRATVSLPRASQRHERSSPRCQPLSRTGSFARQASAEYSESFTCRQRGRRPILVHDRKPSSCSQEEALYGCA